MEIFSQETSCNQIILNGPHFALIDHTATLQGNSLLLEGYAKSQSRRVQLNLMNVRGSILANTWTSMNSIGSVAVHDRYAYGKICLCLENSTKQN